MNPLIEATITFLPRKEGGRQYPVYDGYRPHIYYDGQGWTGEHRYPDVPDMVMPGDTVKTLITVINPEDHPNLIPGKEFEIREGAKVVAHGVVEKRLD